MPMDIELAGIRVRLDGEPKGPPSDEDLRRLLDYAGAPLPPEYLEAMRRMDGLAGWFGDPDDEAYIVLDDCSFLIEVNLANRLKERGSPLLAVGGDGGGEAFAIDLTTQEWVLVNLVDLGSGKHEFRFPNLRAMLDAFIADTAFD